MSEELKNCPLCHSTVKLMDCLPSSLGIFSNDNYNCICYGVLSSHKDNIEDIKRMINLWNTRAYEAEIEELKEKLSVVLDALKQMLDSEITWQNETVCREAIQQIEGNI